MLRTSAAFSLSVMDKAAVAIKRDLIHTFLHHTAHPAEAFMIHLPGFLIHVICEGDFKGNY